jgi:predicted HTH transcriptional regulator
MGRKCSTMETPFKYIRRRGLEALEELLAEREEETLHLEFKTLADHSSGTLTRDDRRTLAKAVCGLANAEGGTLIIRVESQNVEGIDVATGLRPISHVRRVRNRLVSALADFLSPQHQRISELVIVDPAHADAGGYIILHVAESDRRPHMSVPDHRYYRRGSQGTRTLEHA